ncbi:MAG TPA: amidohydrolase family protein [Vicinamibacterales bacterium]|nr:amidohydrolase family protein [Vicinamibacterales bacterium]
MRASLRASLVLVFATTALNFPRAQAASLVIRNVTLIDGTGRPAVPGATVVVEGARITQVTTQPVTPAAGAQIIDGRGKYLIPGLIDVHVHLRGGSGNGNTQPMTPQQEQTGLRALHSFLYCGVTTIFDAGNQSSFIFALRQKERDDAIVSPRILATGGTVTSPGGHGSPYFIESWPEDRSILDTHIAGKPDMAKIGQDEHGWMARPLITKLPEGLLEQIVRYYHSKGVRTVIHTSEERDATEAIYAGVDSLAHPVIQGPISNAFVNLMKVKRIPEASTLTIGESYSRLVDHPEYLDQPLYRATLDAAEIQRLRTTTAASYRSGDNGTRTQWMKVMTPVAQANIRKLNAVGKDIIALGTDLTNGADTQRELELVVAGGVSPADAIVIATRNSARFLGKLDDLGTIEAGKLADLVLLTADPTADINNTKAIDIVVKNGKVIDRTKLNLPGNR